MITLKRRTLPRICYLLALALMAGSSASAARTEQGFQQGIGYVCSQESLDRMECDLRPLSPMTFGQVTARLGDTELAITEQIPYPGPSDHTDILLLVDTSDPRRQAVVEQNIAQVRALARALQPHQRAGLAAFDSDLRMLAPIGSPADVIAEAAGGLAATGKTTELYRSVLVALGLLSQEAGPRRALVLFSDGLAEDRAYGHADCIAAARAADIAIIGLGFPRSAAQSVALQTLRRLSEESGGTYLSSAGDFSLPESFLNNPFAPIDSGARIRLELDPTAAVAGAAHELTLSIATDGDPIALSIPVDTPPALSALPHGTDAQSVNAAAMQPTTPLEHAAPEVAGAPLQEPAADNPVAALPAPIPAPVGAPTTAARSPMAAVDPWIWYGTPAACLLAVVAALILYGRLWHRRHVHVSVVPTIRPLAYLVCEGEEVRRYIVNQSPWRIGRASSNELTLEDHSISRQHAEIVRSADGTFSVHDLDSLNGLFVNERKVRSANLKEGDHIDVGEISLRFTLHDSDYAAQEPTVMLRTRTPI